MPESLYLDPDAGRRAAGLCEAAAAELGWLARDLAQDRCGTDSAWLGDCEEGRGWHRLLRDHATGARSLQWLLDRHAENLSGFAAKFRGVDGVYADADGGAADRCTRL